MSSTVNSRLDNYRATAITLVEIIARRNQPVAVFTICDSPSHWLSTVCVNTTKWIRSRNEKNPHCLNDFRKRRMHRSTEHPSPLVSKWVSLTENLCSGWQTSLWIALCNRSGHQWWLTMLTSSSSPSSVGELKTELSTVATDRSDGFSRSEASANAEGNWNSVF